MARQHSSSNAAALEADVAVAAAVPSGVGWQGATPQQLQQQQVVEWFVEAGATTAAAALVMAAAEGLGLLQQLLNKQ